MHELILVAYLCLSGYSEPRDGSVIFLEGGLLARPIAKHTDSTLTHAAIVLYHGNEPWVYEATLPCVQRMPLADYLRLLHERRHGSWFVVEPRTAYTADELAAMKRYAKSQLGRPYMLRGWWKGHEVRGIFCSEYIADIVEQSGRIVSAHVRESPGSLYAKVKQL